MFYRHGVIVTQFDAEAFASTRRAFTWANVFAARTSVTTSV